MPDHAKDRYVPAAKSWAGASIGEMIAAWGHPTRRFQLPNGEKEGIAWWESLYEGGDYGARGKTIYVHCSTIAHLSTNLTITNIEVRHSRNCFRQYESLFEQMTRGRVNLKACLRGTICR